MSLLETRLQHKGTQPVGMSRLSTPPVQFVGGRLVAIEDNPLSYITHAYNINDIIYSIVKLIMDKIRVAPWNIYKVKDEQSLKLLWGMMQRKFWFPKDFQTARDLQHKALEVLKNPGKWGELMQNANKEQATSDFMADTCGYKLLLGNAYVNGSPLKGGVNSGVPNELHLLPAQYMDIFAENQFPIKVSGYKNRLLNDRPYLVEDVLHIKEWNPNWSINGVQLYGMSPLKAALKLANRDNSSLDSSTNRFQNNGIDGILHMKNQVADGEEVISQVRQLKKTMITEWSGEKNQGKMGISGYDVGWIPLGLSARDMQQIENEKWNLRRLCNPYGVPSQLLNDPENKTFNSLEEAEKALTTRCAMPQLISLRNGYNRAGQNYWGLKSGQIIDFDMTVYTELQQDSEEMVRWLTPLMDRGLPLNRALEMLNLETIDNPYYDLPRVTMAMGQTITEHELTPVDNALNDDGEEDI